MACRQRRCDTNKWSDGDGDDELLLVEDGRFYADDDVLKADDLPTSLLPAAVKGPKGVTAIGVGRSHSCAIAAGGVRWCWGSNGGGQLGNSTVKGNTSVAVKVTGK